MKWSNFICVLVAVVCFGSGSSTANTVDFSPSEVRKILSHGPWPVSKDLPVSNDAGNQYSNKVAAQVFGKALFFNNQLSPSGTMACVNCHQPSKAFADGLARSTGLLKGTLLTRNSPSLFNVSRERWFGWDGAADSIWSQNLRPLFDPNEMGSSPKHLQHFVTSNAIINQQYKAVFSAEAKRQSAEQVSVNIAKAIAAYVATLQSGKTPFDRFRDALALNDVNKMAEYPSSAQRGLQIFVNKGQCSTCHVGPMFSNGEFADIGISFFIRPGEVDSGRHGGIRALVASPFNLLSQYSKTDSKATEKTRFVDLQHRNFGEFKVPSLRNVADTAPYMHNGSLPVLESVVAHYSELNLDRLHADGDQILRPLRLSQQEQVDLVTFLKSLSPITKK
jgi:cytochrome c peroxidase